MVAFLLFGIGLMISAEGRGCWRIAEDVDKWKRILVKGSGPHPLLSYVCLVFNPHPTQTHSRPSPFLRWRLSSYERGGSSVDLYGQERWDCWRYGRTVGY